VLSIGGTPRILVDPGAGTFERVERCGIDIRALEQILLTRLQIDDMGDLLAVLSHLHAEGRNRTIAITGPSGVPGVKEFVRTLAFDGFGITVRETPSALSELAVYSIPVEPVLQELDVSIYAVAVPDGMLPAVAFRVECGEESVVLAGVIAYATPSFLALARDCDALVFNGALLQARGR
jgi:ribonuclease BN (tRNA processing enzyme)